MSSCISSFTSEVTLTRITSLIPVLFILCCHCRGPQGCPAKPLADIAELSSPGSWGRQVISTSEIVRNFDTEVDAVIQKYKWNQNCAWVPGREFMLSTSLESEWLFNPQPNRGAKTHHGLCLAPGAHPQNYHCSPVCWCINPRSRKISLPFFFF